VLHSLGELRKEPEEHIAKINLSTFFEQFLTGID